MFFNYLGYSFGFSLLTLLAYVLLQWLNLPVGNLVDWLIGFASFWWLLAIVTIPWNIYFDAKEVINEADKSREKGIPVDEKQVEYVAQVTRWALPGAIALHLLSALGLYLIAALGISVVGYASSVATLLLTLLRPAVRAYQYISTKLTNIGQEVKYPRYDVIELRRRTEILEQKMKRVEDNLDPRRPASLTAQFNQDLQEARNSVARLRSSLEQLEADNNSAHERILRQSQEAISQLNEDSQVLHQVREIIRFFKSA